MPKVVDHTARRGQITQAVRDLVSATGLDGITVARAAEAAGVSVGQVQHYFANKDDLLEHTYRQVMTRTWERIDVLTRRSNVERLAIRDVVDEALAQRLPLDAERTADHRVVLAFASRAMANPELGELYRQVLHAIRRRLAEAIENGKECGEVAVETDATARSSRLLATVDGLALHLSADASDAERRHARHTVREAVAEVFSGECRQWSLTSSHDSSGVEEDRFGLLA